MAGAESLQQLFSSSSAVFSMSLLLASRCSCCHCCCQWRARVVLFQLVMHLLFSAVSRVCPACCQLCFMFDAVCVLLQLKMEFSTHRDLQVWGNNERNWDFILAPGGPVAAKEAAAAHAAAREAAARDAAAREAAAKDAAARQAARQEVAAEAAAAAAAAGGGGSSEAGAGGAAADAAAEAQGAAAAAAAAAGGIKQPDGSYITTGGLLQGGCDAMGWGTTVGQ